MTEVAKSPCAKDGATRTALNTTNTECDRVIKSGYQWDYTCESVNTNEKCLLSGAQVCGDAYVKFLDTSNRPIFAFMREAVFVHKNIVCSNNEGHKISIVHLINM